MSWRWILERGGFTHCYVSLIIPEIFKQNDKKKSKRAKKSPEKKHMNGSVVKGVFSRVVIFNILKSF